MSRHIEYAITTGRITSYDTTGTPTIIGAGYAGNGPCMNDPSMTAVHGHGPLPMGYYAIGAPGDFPETVGEFAMPLTPSLANQMWGRSGFYIHGDNPALNHTASDGCIVAARNIRSIIALYDQLVVIP
jgi:Protein of unknown function (DUF2778)